MKLHVLGFYFSLKLLLLFEWRGGGWGGNLVFIGCKWQNGMDENCPPSPPLPLLLSLHNSTAFINTLQDKMAHLEMCYYLFSPYTRLPQVLLFMQSKNPYFFHFPPSNKFTYFCSKFQYIKIRFSFTVPEVKLNSVVSEILPGVFLLKGIFSY